jgi:hypothetical protein
MTNDRRREERADDAVVDSAWRKASAEEPDARVDAAILAAARAAVRGRPPAGRATARPPWWMRWQPLAAAAGLVGLAFVLLQLVPREESWRPAPAPEARNEVAVSVPAPAQKTVSARESAESRGTADVAAATEAAAGAAQRSTAEPVAAPRSAAAWAEQIAELHASGDAAAAAAELTAFRQAHADADSYLPQALRSWAASIRPPDAP